MDTNNLSGATLALASMVAQNTNRPLPEIEQHGESFRFVAETPGGWIRVTVEPVEWSDGVPYTPEPVYGDGNESADPTAPAPALIHDPDRLDFLAKMLDTLGDFIDNDGYVPDRYSSTQAGIVADLDAHTIRQAWAAVCRLARWAKYRHPQSASYVSYRGVDNDG